MTAHELLVHESGDILDAENRRLEALQRILLNRAGNRGKGIIRIGANETNSADY